VTVRPLHHVEALRIADEHAGRLRAAWPRPLPVRPALAYLLLRAALWIDPPRPRARPVAGPAARR
jgi:hypothetical protein